MAHVVVCLSARHLHEDGLEVRIVHVGLAAWCRLPHDVCDWALFWTRLKNLNVVLYVVTVICVQRVVVFFHMSKFQVAPRLFLSMHLHLCCLLVRSLYFYWFCCSPVTFLWSSTPAPTVRLDASLSDTLKNSCHSWCSGCLVCPTHLGTHPSASWSRNCQHIVFSLPFRR